MPAICGRSVGNLERVPEQSSVACGMLLIGLNINGEEPYVGQVVTWRV